MSDYFGNSPKKPGGKPADTNPWERDPFMAYDDPSLNLTGEEPAQPSEGATDGFYPPVQDEPGAGNGRPDFSAPPAGAVSRRPGFVGSVLPPSASPVTAPSRMAGARGSFAPKASSQPVSFENEEPAAPDAATQVAPEGTSSRRRRAGRVSQPDRPATSEAAYAAPRAKQPPAPDFDPFEAGDSETPEEPTPDFRPVATPSAARRPAMPGQHYSGARTALPQDNARRVTPPERPAAQEAAELPPVRRPDPFRTREDARERRPQPSAAPQDDFRTAEPGRRSDETPYREGFTARPPRPAQQPAASVPRERYDFEDDNEEPPELKHKGPLLPILVIVLILGALLAGILMPDWQSMGGGLGTAMQKIKTTVTGAFDNVKNLVVPEQATIKSFSVNPTTATAPVDMVFTIQAPSSISTVRIVDQNGQTVLQKSLTDPGLPPDAVTKNSSDNIWMLHFTYETAYNGIFAAQSMKKDGTFGDSVSLAQPVNIAAPVATTPPVQNFEDEVDYSGTPVLVKLTVDTSMEVTALQIVNDYGDVVAEAYLNDANNQVQEIGDTREWTLTAEFDSDYSGSLYAQYELSSDINFTRSDSSIELDIQLPTQDDGTDATADNAAGNDAGNTDNTAVGNDAGNTDNTAVGNTDNTAVDNSAVDNTAKNAGVVGDNTNSTDNTANDNTANDNTDNTANIVAKNDATADSGALNNDAALTDETGSDGAVDENSPDSTVDENSPDGTALNAESEPTGSLDSSAAATFPPAVQTAEETLAPAADTSEPQASEAPADESATEPAETPAPETAPAPTVVPLLTAEADDSALPSLLKLSGKTYEGLKLKSDYSRSAKLVFNDPFQYAVWEQSGVLTFRGGPFRQNAAYGTANIKSNTLTQLWKVSMDGSIKGKGASLTGVAWPGQPLIIKWPTQLRAILGVTDDAKNTKALKEAIVAGQNGYLYSIDLVTGANTREPVKLGWPSNGVLSLQTNASPMLAVGQHLSVLASKKVDNGLHLFNLINNKELSLLNGRDKLMQTNFSGFNGAPLFDKNTGTMVVGGENGLLYTMQPKDEFDHVVGKLTINPSFQRYAWKAAKEQAKNTNVDGAIAMYGPYAYFADQTGILQCVDVNSLTPIWAADTGDNVDATVALDMESDTSVALYTGNTIMNQGRKGVCTIRRYDALTGKQAWAYEVPGLTYDAKSETGCYASPVIGENSVSDLVFFTVTNGTQGATVYALNRSTGAVSWSQALDSAAVSSPVAVYNDAGDAWLIQAQGNGKLQMLNAKTGAILNTLQLEGSIESSPAVYRDVLVICSTGANASYIYGIKLE